MFEGIIITAVVVLVTVVTATVLFLQYRGALREAKNYERGLKMVTLYIHIPPVSDDIDSNGSRDERDLTQEVIFQSQVMYNIIASTVTKGFKTRIYGQRHLSFEIISNKGLVHYYAVVPTVLVDVVKQAISSSYPSVRLEKVEDHNIFHPTGKIQGTSGGELSLKKDFFYPIATYEESKRDAARAILNALSTASSDDGVAIQILLRPADEGWMKVAHDAAESIRKGNDASKKTIFKGSFLAKVPEALWKPPETDSDKKEVNEISSIDRGKAEVIEEKTRHPGYEVLVRVVVSSQTQTQSQVILKNVIASFSLFESSTYNGFKFTPARDIEEFVTAYIFRFFPQEISSNILNSVELATLFHLPDQRSIPTSQVQRQLSKQVDGPTQVLDEGFLLGYNEFRGARKEIRLSTKDRRRHTYMIGQTGSGKSKFLENLAYQDMLDGKGFAFIDPHGDSVEELLGAVPRERVEDVIYFNPGDMEHPVGLNLFEFESDDQKDFLIQESIAMLYRLYDPGHTGIIGPRYEHWFRNAALTVMSDPAGSSFIDVPQVFNDQAFTDEKMKYITDRTVLDFWNKEMAQTSESTKSEVLGWFVSKFGAFLSNEMMRNIIGQTKSGFNLREVMDNKKILLVNLSKGKTGELNSQLLGMIFVMKFQVAAMSRADIPEEDREDFALYVDEFQNFATESFESILSEARKYRLNLILANQFMTQLTDKIREAIIGNIGTIVSGRIGITDAEVLVKRFAPTFDTEDLTRLPNFKTITTVMIDNVPSAPFSMSLPLPMVKANPELRDALKRLSAAKYGRPRVQVEKEIFDRLGSGDAAKKAKMDDLRRIQQERISMLDKRPETELSDQTQSRNPTSSPPSFLDEWIAKRQQQKTNKPGASNNSNSKAETATNDDTKDISSDLSTTDNTMVEELAKDAATDKVLSPRVDKGSDEEVVALRIR